MKPPGVSVMPLNWMDVGGPVFSWLRIRSSPNWRSPPRRWRVGCPRHQRRPERLRDSRGPRSKRSTDLRATASSVAVPEAASTAPLANRGAVAARPLLRCSRVRALPLDQRSQLAQAQRPAERPSSRSSSRLYWPSYCRWSLAQAFPPALARQQGQGPRYTLQVLAFIPP